jgi:hypothetical protein
MGLCGVSASGWLPALAENVAGDPRRRGHCILLWMSGGPSQTDTFDMKPDHENGGEFKEIATSAPGVRFSEHLPLLSKHADKLAIVRSLSTKEGDHERGTYLMRTGLPPMGASQRPSVAAALAKELASGADALPPYVSVAPYSPFVRGTLGPGFLGPKYAPLIVGPNSQNGSPLAVVVGTAKSSDGFAELNVDSIRPPAGVSDARMERRLELWRGLQEGFVKQHRLAAPEAHQTVYENTLRVIHSGAAAAFNLSEEPTKVRERYGKGVFGQGCLLARRLVEQGVPFIEVSLNSASGGGGGAGWDTHSDNFNSVKALSADLDAGWATLMTELEERGLLASTTIIWMGEFGRTPRINGGAGRDHFPRAWSCVLGGGGIAGGQAFGRTSADGTTVEEDKVGAADVLATLCEAIGVPADTENISETGRPLKIVEGTPIRELLS